MSNLCKLHKQEWKQSEYAEHNCDLCKLEKENKKLKESHEQMINGTYNNKDKMDKLKEMCRSAVGLLSDYHQDFVDEYPNYKEELK